MVGKLVEACEFWNLFIGGKRRRFKAVYALAGSTAPRDVRLRRFLRSTAAASI
jgi:hypothetical protein